MNNNTIIIPKQLLQKLGTTDAIVIVTLSAWCKRNEEYTRKEVLKDGYYWTYSTLRYMWERDFKPYFSLSTLEKSINSLKKSDYIIAKKYFTKDNKHIFHYRLNNKKLNDFSHEDSIYIYSQLIEALGSVNKAIVASKILYWQELNAVQNLNIFEEVAWVSLSLMKTWEKNFQECFTFRTFSKIIKQLHEDGVLLILKKEGKSFYRLTTELQNKVSLENVVGRVELLDGNIQTRKSFDEVLLEQQGSFIGKEEYFNKTAQPLHNIRKSSEALAQVPRRTGKSSEALTQAPRRTGKSSEALCEPFQNVGKPFEALAQVPRRTGKSSESKAIFLEESGKICESEVENFANKGGNFCEDEVENFANILKDNNKKYNKSYNKSRHRLNREDFRERFGYNHFGENNKKDLDLIIDYCIEIMLLHPQDMVRMNSKYILARDVQEKFATLNKSHIAIIFNKMRNIKPRNYKTYMLTVLYNTACEYSQSLLSSQTQEQSIYTKPQGDYKVNFTTPGQPYRNENIFANIQGKFISPAPEYITKRFKELSNKEKKVRILTKEEELARQEMLRVLAGE